MLRITLLLTAAAVIAVIAVASSRPPTSAQTDPIVSVDTISDASNTATAVGPIDACRSVASGATFDIDVVIQDVASISGLEAHLLYDKLVLNVTAVSYNFLLASTGATVADMSDTVPDSDGDFGIGAITFPLGSASGSGVLARLTLQAVGSGTSTLDLTNVKLADGNGDPVPPSDPASGVYTGPVNDAWVVVDSSCTDTDGDTVPDDSDNCPSTANGPNEAGNAGVGNQTNTDAANEAAGFRFGTGAPPPILPGDGEGNACDEDDDNDGFDDADERAIYQVSAGSAQELTPCGTATVADPWPANTFSADNVIDISDLGAIVNAGLFTPATGKERYNLFVDGVIDISDLGRVVNAGLFSSCQPPP